jgi:hypothetical protein
LFANLVDTPIVCYDLTAGVGDKGGEEEDGEEGEENDGGYSE